MKKMKKHETSEGKRIGKMFEKIMNMPEELLPSGKFIILNLDENHKWKNIFTKERLRIIDTLRKLNPLSHTELAERLNRKRENVIHDIRVLEHIGLVTSTEENGKVYTRLNSEMIVIPVLRNEKFRM